MGEHDGNAKVVNIVYVMLLNGQVAIYMYHYQLFL